MYTFRFSEILFAMAATLGVTSCAIVGYDYTPTDQNLRDMTVAAARTALQQSLLNDPGDGKPVLLNGNVVSGVKIMTQRIEITVDGSPKIFMLKDIEPKVHQPEAVGTGAYVYLDQKSHIKVHSNDPASFPKGIANALYVLKKSALSAETENSTDEAAFQGALRSYRSVASRPALPEEARKFRVQAESAIRDKDFRAAAGLYRQALTVAPWWPEGHYNRALLLGEVGDYEYAIAEMKRYLVLVPDAPNARAAQDRIYEWEGKTNR
jgi:tetratricopeptide (TPR) repeat protein